jgi:hypothetical protein
VTVDFHSRDLRNVVEVSRLPTCDFCGVEGVVRPARYDFRTKHGPWANGCSEHYKAHRADATLGLGKGQLLIVQDDPLLDPR